MWAGSNYADIIQFGTEVDMIFSNSLIPVLLKAPWPVTVSLGAKIARFRKIPPTHRNAISKCL